MKQINHPQSENSLQHSQPDLLNEPDARQTRAQLHRIAGPDLGLQQEHIATRVMQWFTVDKHLDLGHPENMPGDLLGANKRQLRSSATPKGQTLLSKRCRQLLTVNLQ